MRIAQLSSNVERVPPDGYGGTELVVGLVTDELVARGHEVTLFATGDSQSGASLVSVVEHPLRMTGEAARHWQAYDIRLLLKLQEMEEQFDIIHNHMGWQALPFLAQFKKPVVSTNHNPVKSYCTDIYLKYRHLPYVSISDAYRRLNYPDELNYVATVYNGIDSDTYSGNDLFAKRPVAIAGLSPAPAASPGTKQGQRNYLLFIGRLDKDKGAAKAIEIAKRLNLPLVMAGKIDEADQEYFDKNVKAHIDGDRVKYVGEVGHAEKVNLYGGAIATVYPINFEEPFGLVMAESLASGTPVMAFDRGAVREVLSDGETAIIGHNVEDLVSRFGEIEKIQPENCRARVRQLFSKQRMVDSYESVYKRLVGG